MQSDGHAAATAWRRCRPQPVKVKGADDQQVQVCRKDPALVQITPVKNRQRDAVTMSRYE
ncbi:hypothetical protein QB714_003815 [Salmonella enterica]|nr:hypothetical protein [Salmonella enterica]EKS4627058.1 hypothetical protein [Salmonella enterica]EKS4720099.1 hypothetical protein [Salmonella enterica]EKS4724555.1 hypothetical protein [Salmonella enterica]EKS4738107.1 hypothetical protein [Salmonella enterica]EKS4775989.1 hypothetical protein [Salmonella enterica]